MDIKENYMSEVNEDNLLNGYELDALSIEEIDQLIGMGELSNEDIVWFYNNSQWRY
jgi:hypothetical protein